MASWKIVEKMSPISLIWSDNSVFSKRADLLEDSEPELRLQLKEKSEQVAMKWWNLQEISI